MVLILGQLDCVVLLHMCALIVSTHVLASFMHHRDGGGEKNNDDKPTYEPDIAEHMCTHSLAVSHTMLTLPLLPNSTQKLGIVSQCIMVGGSLRGMGLCNSGTCA